MASRMMPGARRAFWVIFATTFLARAVFVIVTKPYHTVIDGTEETAIARALAERGKFADPFREPTGPSAHSAPGYPMMLSVVYRLFGTGRRGELAKETTSIAITSAQFALLPALAVAAGIPLAAGWLAGGIGAVLPFHPYLESKGEWAAPTGGLWFVILAIYLLRLGRKPAVATRDAITRGALFGAALWFNPVFLPVLAAWLLLEILALRRAEPGAIRGAVMSLLVMAALQVPWAVRNRSVLGTWIWSRSSLGVTLENSFAPYARPGFQEMLEHIDRTGADFTHPNSSVSELRRVRELGEVKYNAEKQRLALHWIRADPARAAGPPGWWRVGCSSSGSLVKAAWSGVSCMQGLRCWASSAGG